MTTIDEATKLFRSGDWAFISDSIAYNFPPGHVRAAEDYLLQQFGEAYVERTRDLCDDPNRAGKLRYRPARMRSG